jgi:hypothetical protein
MRWAMPRALSNISLTLCLYFNYLSVRSSQGVKLVVSVLSSPAGRYERGYVQGQGVIEEWMKEDMSRVKE